MYVYIVIYTSCVYDRNFLMKSFYVLALPKKYSFSYIRPFILQTRKFIKLFRDMCASVKKSGRFFGPVFKSFFAFSPERCFRGTPPKPIFLGTSSG